MSIATTTHSDHDLQTSVQDELDWTPEVDSARIGVAVADGVITLSGEVHSFSQRVAAKTAALRVHGASLVRDALSVHPTMQRPATEAHIRKEVRNALSSAGDVPHTVEAQVDAHKVILTGEVLWDFQRQAAERMVQHLRGVYTVDNEITLTARPSAVNTAQRIKDAFVRSAQLDADFITVSVEGTRAVLTGRVRSSAEKEQAELATWASPHVTHVDNYLMVQAS
ncbi:BON domain-containing protein [Microbacterium hatanonis]|uniref:BON domain-containing protein n=1 Tax=Microbacterium hatanonis TaxID=404366 RepID=A0A5C8I2N0_9MICO|nr:BON domain-containing protein [Microbacterium hatanonis]TXK12340.1 BON domain-containing protein [Microbacterium hatanonis]